MTDSTMAITPSMTVNEIIAAHDDTVAVFHEWGVDACCGGALPISVVADKHGFDLDVLLSRLNAAARKD